MPVLFLRLGQAGRPAAHKKKRKGTYMTARVIVINEAQLNPEDDGSRLCFQYCQWKYEDGTSENGYRFIWRDPEAKLKPARGQAIISHISSINRLVNAAMRTGWGDH